MLSQRYHEVAVPQKYAHIHSPDLVREAEESVRLALARMLLIIISLEKLPLGLLRDSLGYEEIAWDLKLSAQIWRPPWYLCAHPCIMQPMLEITSVWTDAAHLPSLPPCLPLPEGSTLYCSLPWWSFHHKPGRAFIFLPPPQALLLSGAAARLGCRAESCCAVGRRNRTGIEALSTDLSGTAAGSTWQPHACDNPSLGSRSSVGMWWLFRLWWVFVIPSDTK